ncbi:MAG: DUF2961 domain-containing protein [Limisphaera sp.]|nr:DUF2961 domain-containing protein [Limisphaera sp.]
MRTLCQAVALLILGPLIGTAAAQSLTYPDLVRRLVDLEHLATLPQAGERTTQWSSYDRRSRIEPATGRFLDWHANADGHGVIRREGNLQVLAEMKGPGVLWRMWSASPKQGRVRIYLDDAPEPAVDLPFLGYFNREHAPFDRPALVHTAARGWNNYTPIPYQTSCKIVAEEGWGDYYHFTYTTFPEGTVVPTFRSELSAEDRSALEEVDRLLQQCGPRVPQDSLGRDTFEGILGPGDGHALRRTGPAAITFLRARVEGLTRPADEEALRELVLEITWDDEARPAVWSPLGDFFGTAPGANPYRSLPCGLTEDGWFYAQWYMPFGRSAEVRLLNEGAQPRKVHLEVFTERLRRPPESYGRFHAKWHRDEFLPTEATRELDWPLLKTRGRGRYVGAMLHVWNPRGGWWGEGDEKFFVDGEPFPSTFGTGSEDYFGYAWGCPDLFQHAYHNQTRNDGNNKGHISVNRWHIAEQVPFQESFEAYLEKYFSNGRPTLYAATVYWYLAPGGHDPYAPVPLEHRVGYARAPSYKPIPGAVEGERLKILECSRGRVREQDMSGWGEDWSHDAQLWWTGAQPGDRLGLELVVERTARYRVEARFTRAPDYGIVQLFLNGAKLGHPVDLYAPAVLPFGPVPLGTNALAAGTHVLSVEIVGANPEAAPAYLFGLDYIRLTPLDNQSEDLSTDEPR